MENSKGFCLAKMKPTRMPTKIWIRKKRELRKDTRSMQPNLPQESILTKNLMRMRDSMSLKSTEEAATEVEEVEVNTAEVKEVVEVSSEEEVNIEVAEGVSTEGVIEAPSEAEGGEVEVRTEEMVIQMRNIIIITMKRDHPMRKENNLALVNIRLKKERLPRDNGLSTEMKKLKVILSTRNLTVTIPPMKEERRSRGTTRSKKVALAEAEEEAEGATLSPMKEATLESLTLKVRRRSTRKLRSRLKRSLR